MLIHTGTEAVVVPVGVQAVACTRPDIGGFGVGAAFLRADQNPWV